MRKWAWLALAVAAVVVLVAGARRDPTEGSSNDRMYAIAAQMKCMQCVGESVANSQAPLAIQMRAEIIRQMRAGQTDDEIFNYFADRYGQQVLLNPSGSGFASLVWIVPVVVIALGLLGVGVAMTRRRRDPSSGKVQVSAQDRDLVARARTHTGAESTPPADPT
jgi:cytochrome c-type biogenesis protein CcmH